MTIEDKIIRLLILQSLIQISGISRFLPRRWWYRRGIHEARTPELAAKFAAMSEAEIEAQDWEFTQRLNHTRQRWYVKLMFWVAVYVLRPLFGGPRWMEAK